MAWEGERTVTFTMEDALISPAGFMILSGAGLIDAAEGVPVYVHVTETVEVDGDNVEADKVTITLDQEPSEHKDAGIYVMVMKDGEISTEPYLAKRTGEKTIEISSEAVTGYTPTDLAKDFVAGEDVVVLVDYYTKKTSKAQQIEITPDKFGGNYYLEASTLFRDTNGVDMPAEFIIPNCKIQSNFTFTMASSGDPSSFTFTMDAFPDYTRFNQTKKVLAAIQIINESQEADVVRYDTVHIADHDKVID